MLGFGVRIPPVLNLTKSYLRVDDKPHEVQNDWDSDPNDGDSHVEFVKEVLGENEHDESVSHEVEEMVFVEHDEKFNSKQYCGDEENYFQGPAFFSGRRSHGEDLTGSGPSRIPTSNVTLHAWVPAWCVKISLGLNNGLALSDIGEVERLCENFMVVGVWQQISLELLSVGRIMLMLKFFYQ